MTALSTASAQARACACPLALESYATFDYRHLYCEPLSRSHSVAQLKLINEYAYVMEQVMHGTPSGIDNSVSTFGGAVLFVKGQPLQQVQSCVRSLG